MQHSGRDDVQTPHPATASHRCLASGDAGRTPSIRLASLLLCKEVLPPSYGGHTPRGFPLDPPA
jgi:hypothetical protein